MAVYTAIDDPEAYFQVKLYTGTGTSTAFTLDGDTDMQPDAVWFKQRGSNTNHKMFDSVRGVHKALQPNDVDAEATNTNGLTAFGSDGFTIGDHGDLNTSSGTYVAWCWKESVTAGFDIVSYTGNGSARTIAHSLSAVPKMIFIKRLDASANWSVYHVGVGNGKASILNEAEAPTTSTTYFNDTSPTSSVFTVGTISNNNNDGSPIIAYCFADVQGFSKFGSYVGNGNVDGPMIFLGFRPAYVLWKKSDDIWPIMDNKRSTYNFAQTYLKANADAAEDATSSNIRWDFLSNGLKCRGDTGAINGSGGTYIYMAFAEAPFVNSNGVPCNAR